MKLTLKLKDKRGLRTIYHSSKTKRIFSIINREDFLEAFLKVTYEGGFTNSGIYTNKKDLFFALRAFTEKSLVDYLRS